MDAEEYVRREAAGLLAEFPDLAPDQIAAELGRGRRDVDPAIAAMVVNLGRRTRVVPPPGPGPSLLDGIDDEII